LLALLLTLANVLTQCVPLQGPSFVLADAREATDEELLREGTHSQAYLSAMAERTAEAIKILGHGKTTPGGGSARIDRARDDDDDYDDEDDGGSDRVLDSFRGKQLPSAAYSIATERAARAGTAALIDATLGVLAGDSSSAFVLCRPPTHHAVGNEDRCRNTSPKVITLQRTVGDADLSPSLCMRACGVCERVNVCVCGGGGGI
jgi:acetoin utilization deacetylase AcuC-like enzyme